MNTDERGFFDSLTERVLGAVFEVSNTLGVGFLEKVYERALLRELGLQGIRATSQASFAITYKGHCVGDYFADILVEDVLVVELKCVERLANEHTAQCAMSQLFESLRSYALSSSQFSEAQSRVEAYRPWISDSRLDELDRRTKKSPPLSRRAILSLAN
jgi:GxxExxY protein